MQYNNNPFCPLVCILQTRLNKMESSRDAPYVMVREVSITYVGLQLVFFLFFAFLVLGVIVLFIDNAEWLYRKINHCIHPTVIITGEEDMKEESEPQNFKETEPENVSHSTEHDPETILNKA